MASVGLSRNARLMRLAIHSRIILPTNPYARPVSQRRRHLSVRISVSRPRLQQRENEASSAISTGDRRAGSQCPFGGPAQLRKMRTQMKNLPNQSRSVVMVGQNNRRPENEKVIDPEWPKGKKFRKPIPPKSRS